MRDDSIEYAPAASRLTAALSAWIPDIGPSRHQSKEIIVVIGRNNFNKSGNVWRQILLDQTSTIRSI
jgi:hypothetical protein